MSMSLTPPSTDAIQALLRADPDAAFGNYGFVVDSSVYTAMQQSQGGQCLVVCSPIAGNICRLHAQQGTGDFYYPYVQKSSGGVGYCTIPIGQRNGVLVLTGGMNGCSLQVNQDDVNFYFFHDCNGNSMQDKTWPGVPVSRVDFRQYEGIEDEGGKLSRKMTAGGARTADEHHLIAVRHKGMWKIYASSLLRTTAVKTTYPFGFGEEYTETTFTPINPRGASLVAMFPDSAI